nr:LPS responsive vesicle trafficking beach [Hymenolepis microstoma]
MITPAISTEESQMDKAIVLVGFDESSIVALLLITSREAKEKDLQHCVPTELQPCRWYMLTLVFVYNRWTKSELRFHVDEKINSSVDMAWPISTSDSFDRCMIGGAFDQRRDYLFSGRIASITRFTEALFRNYNGQLKFELGVRGILNETERNALIESKLSAPIMSSYHPSACDHNLCLDQSPKPNSVFVHALYALMQRKVNAVRTTPLQSALQSLGGIHLLYLLLEQLNSNFEDAIESGATMD